jgi:hypothetical protein
MQALLGNAGAHVLADGPIKDLVERLRSPRVETTVPDNVLEWPVSVNPIHPRALCRVVLFSPQGRRAPNNFTRRRRQWA